MAPSKGTMSGSLVRGDLSRWVTLILLGALPTNTKTFYSLEAAGVDALRLHLSPAGKGFFGLFPVGDC